MSGASIGAVTIARKKRDILNAFVTADALCVARAKSAEELQLSPSLLLQIQKMQQVIITLDDQHMYLDMERYKTIRSRKRLIVLSVLPLFLILTWVLSTI